MRKVGDELGFNKQSPDIELIGGLHSLEKEIDYFSSLHKSLGNLHVENEVPRLRFQYSV